MNCALTSGIALLAGITACHSPDAAVATPPPVLPHTGEQWVRALQPASPDSLAWATVQGDTLELSFLMRVSEVRQLTTHKLPPPGVAQLRRWFSSSALLQDTIVAETAGQRLRNKAGSVVSFCPKYGVLSAYIVDSTCRWEGLLAPGMSKQQVFDHYFTRRLDLRLLHAINTLYLPSGMNYNGVYFTFNGDKLARIIDLELPD